MKKWHLRKHFFGYSETIFGSSTVNSLPTAVAHSQQVLLQDLLSKSVNRIVWQKVPSREFWPTCCKNCGNKGYNANLCLDKEPCKTDTLFSLANNKNVQCKSQGTGLQLTGSLDVKNVLKLILPKFNRSVNDSISKPEKEGSKSM